MKRLLVKSAQQIADLWDDQQFLKSYIISTAANGLGCEKNSYCTPSGKLKVAEKIGEGSAIGTVFKSRVATGEVWNQNDETSDDLILTRILWLAGAEDKNKNTLDRYIYLHGTNHEDKLGKAVSHGCVRFSNSDILEIYEHLNIGSEVFIE
jgi:L,D-transpeptidase catalytic domain